MWLHAPDVSRSCNTSSSSHLLHTTFSFLSGFGSRSGAQVIAAASGGRFETDHDRRAVPGMQRTGELNSGEEAVVLLQAQ
jgi:hypothetical protein